MKEQELRAAVLAVLTEVAPEVEAGKVEPAVNFRDQFDFDSMDFLNFAMGLSKKLGIEIPETSYPRLSNLDGCVTFLKELLSATVR